MGVVNVTTPHRRNPSSAKSTKIKN
jgi:hypothetical protein